MALLNDLMDLSQHDENAQKPTSETVDLHALLSETLTWWQREATRKGLELSFGIDMNVATLAHIDAPRVQKVLNNLFSNAIKFNRDGRISLNVTLEDDSGLTRFTVLDNGPGLDARVLANLDRAFTDSSQEFEKEHGGLGVGLSVSKNLAKKLGGSLELRNVPGGGCEASLIIPVEPASQPAMQGRPVTLSRQGTDAQPVDAKHVLVAEDNPLNQTLMRTLLEELGWRVTLAKDGVEAVELAWQGGYHAILMDITMPQLDGVAATELIHALPAPISDVPIVACTAHIDEESQARYRRAGMAGLLPKPVRAEDIVRLLGQVTEESAHAQSS